MRPSANHGSCYMPLTTSEKIDLGAAVVNGIALLGVVVSLLLLRSQTKAQRNATLALAYQNIAGQMLELDRFFVANVELRKYFYDGVAVAPSDPHREKLLLVSEMLVDFGDNVLMQCPALEQEHVAEDWRTYFRDVYDKSPILREFWTEYARFYSHSPLQDLFPSIGVSNDAVE